VSKVFACTPRAQDDENRHETTQDDEQRKGGADRGILTKPAVSWRALKRPQKPSHGRGHWFDPSSAHSENPLHLRAVKSTSAQLGESPSKNRWACLT
jgi:hypothetical protein